LRTVFIAAGSGKEIDVGYFLSLTGISFLGIDDDTRLCIEVLGDNRRFHERLLGLFIEEAVGCHDEPHIIVRGNLFSW